MTVKVKHKMSFSRHSFKDISNYSKPIIDLKWSKEGKYLGMVSMDKVVKVGQLDQSGSFQNVQTISSNSNISQVCWHPTEESRFTYCGDEKMVELWDVRASRAASKLSSVGNNLNMAWSLCGNYIVVGNKNDVLTVFDTRTGLQIRKKKFSYEVNELAWTANSNFFLAAIGGDGYGSVDIVSLDPINSTIQQQAQNNSSLTVVDSISAHVSNCFALKIDADYQHLAVGSSDFSVSLWDLEDMICRHTISMESEIRTISFNGDGSRVAIISDDLAILICDTDTGEGLCKVPYKNGKIASIAWHPNKQQQHRNLIAVAPDEKAATSSSTSLFSSSSSSPQYLRFLSFA